MKATRRTACRKEGLHEIQNKTIPCAHKYVPLSKTQPFARHPPSTCPRRRANTALAAGLADGRSGGPLSAVARPAPPGWEPVILTDDENSAAFQEATEWSEEDEHVLRARIREAMAKIDSISGGLGNARKGAGCSRGGGSGRATSTADGRRTGGTGTEVGVAESRRNRRGGGVARASPEDESSIDGLHGALKLSLELVTTGERHASANTTAIADMSEWLLNLEQKQLVRSGRVPNYGT